MWGLGYLTAISCQAVLTSVKIFSKFVIRLIRIAKITKFKTIESSSSGHLESVMRGKGYNGGLLWGCT